MQVKVVALAAGAAVLLVALQAFSQTGDEAAAKSLADLRVRAEQGDAEAQVELGHMYANGDGVPEDDAEAVRWFRLAAEQGHVEAQVVLGILYAAGNGVPKDDAEALRWVRRAAEQGSARATYGLGVMYATGAAGRVGGEVAAGPPGPQVGDDDGEFALWLKSAIGENVQQDDAEAVRWFRLGIEQGDAGSQFALGLMYAAGEGVPQDAAEAERLMRRAAEQGDGMAQFLLWDELEGAEALRWVRRAAEQDHAWAQFYLGLMYDAGAIKYMPVFFGLSTLSRRLRRSGDDAEALRWYRRAAEQDHAWAQNYVRDIELRLAAEQGAEQGDATAQTVSGTCMSPAAVF